MGSLQDLVNQFEYHSPEGIKRYFSEGVDPNSSFNGKPLFVSMVEMYTRSARFKDCIQVFVDFGLVFDDTILLAVLLDDAAALKGFIKQDPLTVSKRYSAFNASYTPLQDVSLLHICAEYNHLACAKVLVENGANINDKAGTDEYGFGGQTPVFHTVNQNNHQSADMMHYLLSQSADLVVTVKGITWGKGYEWETLVPAVNPVSYAMMGLLPQMHRDETTISKTISLLLKHAYGIDYSFPNVPCAYLKK